MTDDLLFGCDVFSTKSNHNDYLWLVVTDCDKGTVNIGIDKHDAYLIMNALAIFLKGDSQLDGVFPLAIRARRHNE